MRDESLVSPANQIGTIEFPINNFHELAIYYPMRVLRSGDYKLIWNIAHRLSYPFASDLWASSTWQIVIRVGGENFGSSSVRDYLYRDEF